jgi:hypothetical protein
MAARQKRLPLSKLAVAILILYFGIIELEGFVRWALGFVHLQSLLYVRDLLPLLAAPMAMRADPSGRRNLVLMIMGLQVILASIVGLIFCGNVIQVIFGMRVFIPVLLGVAIYPAIVKNWDFFARWCLILLGIGVTGVVINQFVQFPWIGSDFTAFNVTVELSREWTEVSGRDRLPGFSRASYDAATQIVFLSLVSLYWVPGFFKRVLIAALATYAIYLTTSKVAFACMLQLLVNFFVLEGIPALQRARIGTRLYRFKSLLVTVLRLQIAFFTIAMVILPLNSTGTLNYLERDLHEGSEFHLLSMQDRATNVWPRTLEHIHRHGNWWLGAGIGGIGAPLDVIGQVEIPITADNAFLYLYGVFGLISGIYFILLLWVTFTRRMIVTSGTSLFAMLALSACIQGVSKGTFEGLYDCVFTGFLIAHLVFGWRGLPSRTPPPTPATGSPLPPAPSHAQQAPA